MEHYPLQLIDAKQYEFSLKTTMITCEICGTKVSEISDADSAVERGLEFSFIELGNPTANENLFISAQNHMSIEPLGRQIGEYEAAIIDISKPPLAPCPLATKAELGAIQQKIARHKDLFSRRDKDLREITQQKELMEQRIAHKLQQRLLLNPLIKLTEDIKMSRSRLFAVLRKKRYGKAQQLFQMFGISWTKNEGCSYIMGLAFPNSGYYEECPLDLICTVLSHIAHFMDSLSVCLNIPLPHPLSPFEPNGPTISPQYSQHLPHNLLPFQLQSHREEYRSFCWKSLRTIRNELDDANLHYSIQVNTYFAEALSLLQANSIALCLKIGLDPEDLHPPHSILPNLLKIKDNIQNSLGDEITETIMSPVFHHNFMLDHAVLEDQLLQGNHEVASIWTERHKRMRGKELFSINISANNQEVKTESSPDDEWDIVTADPTEIIFKGS